MLPRARKSVTSQNFSDFVWVIVNDAGQKEYVDENAELARNDGLDVVTVHNSESTMDGATHDGVQSVDSTYVAVHDDDDTWHPDFMIKMVRFLDENEEYLGAVCHEVAIYEEFDETGVSEIRRVANNTYLDGVQLADMLQQNLFAPISFLFRRSIYDKVGGWDGRMRPLADWDFALKVLLQGDIAVVPEKLAYYHIRESVESGQFVYGNSITAGVNTHMSRDARYRNQKLREDLANGTVGLGFLLCQGRQTSLMAKNVNFMARVFRLPQSGWNRIKNRFRRGFSG